MSYAKVPVLCLILTKYKIMFSPDEKKNWMYLKFNEIKIIIFKATYSIMIE